ncbi:hypothetical protein [Dickeya fangzhongdai]|uniref:hypothetical protein n=1 Tax=Dickeya fangzhongdai TaxID=1778540 RepID=UPI001ADA42E5|nr:hypothetical protein [Dickeya fangzhongdai]MBO8134672.1 hypothetical protein [Dickeya fangzhongdai]
MRNNVEKQCGKRKIHDEAVEFRGGIRAEDTELRKNKAFHYMALYGYGLCGLTVAYPDNIAMRHGLMAYVIRKEKLNTPRFIN